MEIERLSPNGTSYSFYSQDGHDEDTQTLVFIHGVGLNQQVWQPQIDHFAAHYRILVYDMLGHGGSREIDGAASLDDYIVQLAQLLEHLQMDRVSIIGHSMGALISVGFALAYPQRVEALIPLNIVYRRNKNQRAAVVERATKVLEVGRVVNIEHMLMRWFVKRSHPDRIEKVIKVRQWLSEVDPIEYGKCYWVFAHSDRAFVGRLQELSMPVLYLTGKNDPNSRPSMSRRMASETPNGQVEVIPKEAHMMAYLHPEKVNPILDEFLGKTL